MCCKRFWIGIGAFSIAFLLSLFSVGLESLLPAPLPNVEPVNIAPKKCDAMSLEFNKYKNYSVERLEKEYLRTMKTANQTEVEIVVRNEKGQDLTIEETKILRRNIKEDFPGGNTKMNVLMKLIKYKNGVIKELPYDENCVEN